MSADAKRLTGRCLCGAVRFSAVPKSLDMAACHCSMCRRWSGSPWFAVDAGDTLQIEDPSAAKAYRSSQWAERLSCATCGGSLFYRLVGQDQAYISAEAFDDPSVFRFTHEIFIDEKPDRYAFANETQKMTGAEVFAAVMSGGEEG